MKTAGGVSDQLACDHAEPGYKSCPPPPAKFQFDQTFIMVFDSCLNQFGDHLEPYLDLVSTFWNPKVDPSLVPNTILNLTFVKSVTTKP